MAASFLCTVFTPWLFQLLFERRVHTRALHEHRADTLALQLPCLGAPASIFGNRVHIPDFHSPCECMFHTRSMPALCGWSVDQLAGDTLDDVIASAMANGSPADLLHAAIERPAPVIAHNNKHSCITPSAVTKHQAKVFSALTSTAG